MLKSISTSSRNGILALNILFAGILAAVSFAPTSEATTFAQHRFQALPGLVNGLPSGVVYVMDTTAQELVAVAYDQSLNQLRTLGHRNLSSDAKTVPKN